MRRHGNSLCDTMRGGSGAPPAFRGAMDCARFLIRRDGVAGLWRGNFAGVARYVPTQAVALSFKDTFSKLFGRDRRRDGFTLWATGQLMEGAVAGTVAQCVGHPFDFVRTRLACDVSRTAEATATDAAGRRYGGREFAGGRSAQVVVQTLQAPGGQGGVAALYRGFTAACLHAAVHRGALLGGFAVATETNWLDPVVPAAAAAVAPLLAPAVAAADAAAAKHHPLPTLSSAADDAGTAPAPRAAVLAAYQLVVGWGAAAVATWVAHPLDTLKTRAMLVPMDRSRPHGAVALAGAILREEGLRRGLFRGASLNVVRCFATGAVLAAADPARAAYVRWRGADDSDFGAAARSRTVARRSFNEWKF